MDDSDENPVKDCKRLRYDRDVILAIKDNASAILPDLFDKSALDVATQRGNRGKPKTASRVQDRSRDLRIIFLGPHKRTWNTGCHVSNTEKDVSENLGRGCKSGSDYRPEKGYTRNPGEYKTEFRGATRDRPNNRRYDMFSRMHPRDDRKPHRSEEEPEWFLEGPTTVNDTIELGRVIEDDDDGTSTRVAPSKISVSDTNQTDTNSKEDHELSSTTNSVKDNPSVNPLSFPHLESRDTVPVSRVSEAQGSRFKHLFTKTDTDSNSDTNTGKVNDQLLKLLKGSNSTSTPNQKNNVLQVENKLRSMLLGHNHPRNKDDIRSKLPDNKSSKPQVLTVEEIEAQLRVPLRSSPGEPTQCIGESLRTEIPENASERFSPQNRTNTFADSQPTGSSLAPILQSLTLRQQQQSNVCPKPMHTPFNPFGILSNSMARLPTSTNAVAASARINQLQQPDLIQQQQTMCSVVQQGLHEQQLWENNPGPVDPLSPRNVPNNSQLPSGGILSDIHFRSSLGLNTANPNSSGFAGPRRPIVKVQHGLSGTHNSQFLSPLPTTTPLQGHCGLSAASHDVDRRLLNLAFKQQIQANGASTNIPDKGTLGGGFPNARGDLRFGAHNISQQFPNPSFVSFLSGNSGIVNNNNNLEMSSPPSKMQTNHPNANTLAFLSQLVEMDRTSYPKPSASLNPLLAPVGVAKTLDEIEHL